MMPRQPEDVQSKGAGAEAAETDVQTLKQALAKEKERAEGYLASWQRAQADFINYKRRCEQEKAESGDYAKTRLIVELLPALDDLERALAAIPPEAEKMAWVEGMRLIGRKLEATFEAAGISPIKAVGQPFDPRFHEAVRQVEGKDGIVMAEVEKGYCLKDKVVRPSKVVVGNGEGEENKEE